MSGVDCGRIKRDVREGERGKERGEAEHTLFRRGASIEPFQSGGEASSM